MNVMTSAKGREIQRRSKSGHDVHFDRERHEGDRRRHAEARARHQSAAHGAWANASPAASTAKNSPRGMGSARKRKTESAHRSSTSNRRRQAEATVRLQVERHLFAEVVSIELEQVGEHESLLRRDWLEHDLAPHHGVWKN
jgi:hypothetical protein